MASRTKLLPFALPVVIAALLLLGGWFWLGSYTRHGIAVRVPDLRGMAQTEAIATLKERGLEAEVIDSVYNDEARKGTVVLQDPIAGHDVKPGRKIYLTMNALMPKMIDMPALVNLSKRQAISTLEIIGLKVKELQYKSDPCVDCVLDQLYKGVPIRAEERIRRGEAITLVLGSGEGGERVHVPDLRGLTFAEVGAVLNMASLNLGVTVDCKGCNNAADSTLARVYRQSPEAWGNNMIAMGGTIDIWLTADTAGLQPNVNWADSIRLLKDTAGSSNQPSKTEPSHAKKP
jgi:beta-lactam-binding protein with PASTA domain